MTDQTAAVEVWARMLCAADVHVNDGDHPTWQQLSAMPGGRDEYRKAARWLLPRLTVAQPAPSSEPVDADLRDRIRRAVAREFRGVDYSADDLDPEEFGSFADAVLAVLPAPADRAAVLREAADVLETLPADATSFDEAEHKYKGGAAAETLRRMADEVRQAECACDPAPHRQLDGTYSHWAGCPVAEAEQLLEERAAAAKEQPVSLPPQLQAALDVMAKRGRVVELTARRDDPDVVAYRNSDRPGVLLCREHGDGWMGLTPLTSDDLPDGGLCSECGVDVLIQQQQQAGEGR